MVAGGDSLVEAKEDLAAGSVERRGRDGCLSDSGCKVHSIRELFALGEFVSNNHRHVAVGAAVTALVVLH